MGYTVRVRTGTGYESTWSDNISHGSISAALGFCCQQREVDGLPMGTITALNPGYNGTRIDHPVIVADAGKLRELADLAEELRNPYAWVLHVLADAYTYALLSDGSVLFD